MDKIKPIRIQRSRQHKQESRNGLPIVYVGRPGKWGNPFIVGTQLHLTAEQAVKMYSDYLIKWEYQEEIIAELKGKNLSCWCKIGEPCHADVLLEIANS